MKKKSVWALALAAMLMWVGKPAAAAVNESFDPVEYVNPLMGTQSSYELSTGNTYPAIARPWGMNFWTPQTGKMGDGMYIRLTRSVALNRPISQARGSMITDNLQSCRWLVNRNSTKINVRAGSRIKERSPRLITIRYIWRSMTW